MRKKIIYLIAVCMLSLSSVSATVPGEKAYLFVTENYVVQSGDTLDSITEHYIVKNTYGPREFKEFREGIRENNYKILKDRDIEKGDTLVITYWVKNPNVVGED
jgi:hypothetical protein